MKKETIIAVAFGIIFGAILAFFLIVKNKESQLSKNKTIESANKLTPSAAKNNGDEKLLTIDSPTDGTIVNQNSITIKGTVEKGVTIVIQSPIKDIVLKSDNTTFSTAFPLATGENVIDITVYAINGQVRSQEKQIRVYFLDEQL